MWLLTSAISGAVGCYLFGFLGLLSGSLVGCTLFFYLDKSNEHDGEHAFTVFIFANPLAYLIYLFIKDVN